MKLFYGLRVHTVAEFIVMLLIHAAAFNNTPKRPADLILSAVFTTY